MRYWLAGALVPCCLALAGCDQYATIGAPALMYDAIPIDAGVDAPLEPPKADAATDADADARTECVAPEIIVCDPFSLRLPPVLPHPCGGHDDRLPQLDRNRELRAQLRAPRRPVRRALLLRFRLPAKPVLLHPARLGFSGCNLC